MRDYGRISVSLWMSRKFRSLRNNDQARLLYLYLHTCPQANSIGCFALPKGYAASDLGWNDRAINRAIEALREASLIAWNETEELVRITGFLEHSPLTNIKHAKGAIKLALALPECDEKISVCKDLLSDPWAKNDADLKRASIGLSKPSDTTETETETDIEVSSLRSDTGVAEVDAPNDVIAADFDLWWEQFPRYRRGSKEPARKKFIGIIRRKKASSADLLAGLSRYNAAGYADSEFACGAERWLNDQRWTIEHFPPPGDKQAKAQPTGERRYSNASLARSLLQDIDHEHDSTNPGRNGAAIHRAEGHRERGAGAGLPAVHLRLAGPDDAD